MPDVGQMPGKAARHDEHGVDPHGIAGAGKTRRQSFGRNCDAAQSMFIERPGCCIVRGALLYLDERDRPAATSDDVDFAARYASAPS